MYDYIVPFVWRLISFDTFHKMERFARCSSGWSCNNRALVRCAAIVRSVVNPVVFLAVMSAQPRLQCVRTTIEVFSGNIDLTRMDLLT